MKESITSKLYPFHTPWKIRNRLERYALLPFMRLYFTWNGISWGESWSIDGKPIIHRHRLSVMSFGKELKLRSNFCTNPLGVQHPVYLTTWSSSSVLEIGNDFAMTGGVICVFERVTIGNHVMVGANSKIIDTDFHPLDPDLRRQAPMAVKPKPVHIEDDVFIGMHSIILKGTTIGKGSVVGAGSVVSGDVPSGVVVAGNPAKIIRELK